STRSTPVASTSAPAAARSTTRPTRETRGARSCATCPRCSRSKSRYCRDPGGTAVIRVVLPAHLKNLARLSGEVRLDVAGPATQRRVLDALEEQYPMLRGTIRDRQSGQRRAFIRFYACEEDLSNESPDAELPDRVVKGEEPFLIVGAMAGG